jgi:exopolyphosphatase/guanosine-5'-triphosphate,3'-diphosphate pyrophosphatase
MKIAAIDIGSNSIHMVVARIDAGGHFTLLDRAKEPVRLGRGTLTSRALSAAAMQAGLETLATFKRLADTLQVEKVLSVATSAVRESKNGGDFISQIGRTLGIHVDVITGREEARLIYLAVSNALDLRNETVLLADVGGGSVELVLAEGGSVRMQESLKLGVIRLGERFFTGDRAKRDDLDEAERYLDRQLARVRKAVEPRGPRRLIGTSGTVLNLVAIAHQLEHQEIPERLNAVTVSYKDVAKLRDRLVRMDREERKRLPGLDRRRADLIVPGAVLIEHLMRSLGLRELTACDWALREGVILDFIGRHREEIAESDAIPDPRRRSVLHMARRLQDDLAHAEHVTALALALFDKTAELHELAAAEREWLEYAALLHDVGNHIAHSRHHRHSYYLIVNGELMGFEPDEIRVIAAIARFHRKGGPKDDSEEMQALPAALRPVVTRLAAILRIADGLDRSHFGLVRDLDVARAGGHVTVRIDTAGHDAELELWAARRKADLFEATFDTRLILEVKE